MSSTKTRFWQLWKVVNCAAQASTLLLANPIHALSYSITHVFLFRHTDDFWRDFNLYKSNGVVFVREPKTEDYGIVAVFQDLHGNQWDLVQPSATVARNDANRSAHADAQHQVAASRHLLPAGQRRG